MSQIPSEYVVRNYTMDPSTEDLVPYGDGLVEGMIVIAEGIQNRIMLPEDISQLSDEMVAVIKKFHRWFRVSHLRLVGTESISFVGTFADGTKHKFTHPTHDAWFVKKDSIPELDDEEADRSQSYEEYRNTALKPGDDILVATPDEASNVANKLNELINTRGTASWRDLKQLLGIETRWIDEQYRWNADARFHFFGPKNGLWEVVYPTPNTRRKYQTA